MWTKVLRIESTTKNFSVLKSQYRAVPSFVKSVMLMCDGQYLNLVNKDYLVVLQEPLK